MQYLAASSHDGLASGMYQKLEIPRQVNFCDSVLLSGLWKNNNQFKSLDNELYALRAQKIKDIKG